MKLWEFFFQESVGVFSIQQAKKKKNEYYDWEDRLQWAQMFSPFFPVREECPDPTELYLDMMCVRHWNVSRHDVYHIKIFKYKPGF